MKKQYVAGSCAQHAMQAALVMLGRVYSLDTLHHVTVGVVKAFLLGTGTPKIIKGLKRLGYASRIHLYDNDADAKKALDVELQDGNPCIMAVNNSRHWITIIGKVASSYAWYDGYTKDTLIGIAEWEELHKWMVANIEDDDYCFIAVKHKDVTIVSKMAHIYSQLKEHQFTWMNDLLDMQLGFKNPRACIMKQLYTSEWTGHFPE
jgi:hypothetical protein